MGEKEARRRSLGIHLWRLRVLLDLSKLEAADIVAGHGVGRAAEKARKDLAMLGYSHAVTSR